MRSYPRTRSMGRKGLRLPRHRCSELRRHFLQQLLQERYPPRDAPRRSGGGTLQAHRKGRRLFADGESAEPDHRRQTRLDFEIRDCPFAQGSFAQRPRRYRNFLATRSRNYRLRKSPLRHRHHVRAARYQVLLERAVRQLSVASCKLLVRISDCEIPGRELLAVRDKSGMGTQGLLEKKKGKDGLAFPFFAANL